MKLANRIVMPPMTTLLAGSDGEVTDRFIDFYTERARGGAALICAETAEVHPYTHNLSIGDRGFTALYDDRFIPGFRRFTAGIHAAGAKASVQLHHSGGAMVMVDPSLPPLAPSAIPCPGGQLPRALSIGEIEEIVEAFGAAAGRAREAGFDAVDIHGGHGYLIAQFMSAYFNRRSDEYGGDLLGRLRFPIEVLHAVRRNVGEDFPIIFRFSVDERVPEGRDVEESTAIAPLLVEAGADCLSITTGMHFTLLHTVPAMGMPKGLNLRDAAAVRAAVDVPVMAVGKLNDPVLAEAALAQGQADLVAIGRGLIADPELPRKFKDDRWEDIRWCIACNQGCIGGLVAGSPFTCLVNPDAGREGEMKLEPASVARHVLVAGAGPAGLEAARVAALRGHRVTVYEQSDTLGGQFHLASLPPRKQEISPYLRYLRRQLDHLCVEIVLGKALTAALVAEADPDVVIVATGSRPFVPAMTGIDAGNVVTAHDVLAGKASVGERVLVAGGGQVGCETAEFLDKSGKQITIVEQQPELAADVAKVPRDNLLHSLRQTDVKAVTSARIVEITADGVRVERAGRHEALGGADSIVLALGVTPVGGLAEEIADRVPEIHVIGDARRPGSALDAIAAAAEIGRQI
jgi:2,4-dienoyl-CoA reductase-like NADH-dependent reductase (Old Yellow Enzyme family)/thioredoxin reductase